MKYEFISKAVKTIKDKVLTPVIYMSEHEEFAEFICFCDRKITMQEIYDTEKEIEEILGIQAEIVDIREFSEHERLEIIGQCELVYSENNFIEKLFESSMVADYQKMMNEKYYMINRQKECGTFYVQ